jgi:hypothetical protein
MTDFNTMMHDAFAEQYTRLKQAGIDERCIHITATKSYADDSFTIEYNIGGYGDADKAKGSDLHAVITEYMRRKGWTERNKPMVMLSAPAEFT